MEDKLKFAFLPALWLYVGLMGGYTFFHWLLVIQLDWLPLKEVVLHFWAPIGLTGLMVLLMIRPRLKILNLKANKGNLRMLYCFVLWILLAVPLVIAQEYLVVATGKLTAIHSIEQIDSLPPTKYYTLEEYFIDKRNAGFHAAFDVSGRYNDNFNMHIYAVAPILKHKRDTLGGKASSWLGIAYHKTIRNNLSAEEKEARYRGFAHKSRMDFNEENIHRFVYLNRVGNSGKRDGYLEAMKDSPGYEQDGSVLEGINEPFHARYGKKLEWILALSAAGLVIWLCMTLLPKVDAKELKRIKAGRPDLAAWREWRDIKDLSMPRKGFFVTPVLLGINTSVFLAMTVMGLGFISFNAPDLLAWGANYGPWVCDGEWWRLLTSIFLHGGLVHLLFNSLGLGAIGLFLEPVLGTAKYLTIYVLTGILASAASVWWHDATVSVGASGAVFGLYGVFLAFLLKKVYPTESRTTFLTGSLVFIGLNLAIGLFGNIDNAAHIGGLISGFAIGMMIHPSRSHLSGVSSVIK